MKKASLLKKKKKLNTLRRNCTKTNKELKEAMKDTIKGYKQTIFVSDSSTYMACLEERRRQQVIYKKYVIKS